MASSVAIKAFEAAILAKQNAITNHLSDEDQLKAAIAAYLDILHIHVMEDTPSDEYALTKEEADDIFKPQDLEIEM